MSETKTVKCGRPDPLTRWNILMTVFRVFMRRAGIAEGIVANDEEEDRGAASACDSVPPLLLVTTQSPGVPSPLDSPGGITVAPDDLTIDIALGAETVRAIRCRPVPLLPAPPARAGEIFPGVSSSSSENLTRPTTRLAFAESVEFRLAVS